MTDQLKNLVFTLNNPSLDKDSFADEICAQLEIEYLIIGDEIGESGTHHFQGFLQLKKKTRFKKLHTILRNAHIEPLRGTPTQADDYCKKDSNFIQRGQLKIQESIAQNNISKWKELLHLAQSGQMDELRDKYPGEYIRYQRGLSAVRVEGMKAASTDKFCLWIFGEPGTGKSRFSRDYDDNAYWKNPNKWWDNFDNGVNKTVIIDDIDKSHKVLGYHIKRWSDRYPVLCETKGSAMYPEYNTLIITSNYSIDEIWDDDKTLADAIKRRFHIYKVMGFEETLEGLINLKIYDPLNLTTFSIINKFNLNN